MNAIKKIMLGSLITLTSVFGLCGCYEVRYVHRYNHHTRGWYDRRHVAPPPGVTFEVDTYHGRRW